MEGSHRQPGESQAAAGGGFPTQLLTLLHLPITLQRQIQIQIQEQIQIQIQIQIQTNDRQLSWSVTHSFKFPIYCVSGALADHEIYSER